MKSVTLKTVLLAIPLLAYGCSNQHVTEAEEIPVQMDKLVGLVQTALTEAQTTYFAPGGLEISKAKLSLTVVEKINAGGKVSFVIFTVGGSQSNKTTHNFEVTFAVPKAAAIAGIDEESIKGFMELTKSVAEEIEFSGERNPLTGAYEVQQLTATISFAIEKTVKGELGLTFGSVEVGPSASHAKSNAQKLVLVIGRKS